MSARGVEPLRRRSPVRRSTAADSIASAVQKFLVLAGERRLAREHAADRRREPRQVRQQLETDAVARNAHVGVRRVLAKTAGRARGIVRAAPARAMSSSGRTTRPARGRIPASPRRARTADQPQQERLRLIVERVADGDGVGAERSAASLRNAYARLRAPRLRSSARSRERRRRRRRARRGTAARGAPPDRGRSLVRVRLGAAELMIEMRRTGDDQFAAPLERAQHVKERHRVGAARQAPRAHARPRGSMPCFRWCAERGMSDMDIMRWEG